MKKTSSRTVLFDIPEDKTIDSDDLTSNGSCIENEVSSVSPKKTNRLFGTWSSKWKKRPSVGANVKTLRGIYGSDFEGYAVVCPGTSNHKRNSLGSLLSKQNAPKERYLFIKGAFMFVFKDEKSPSPKYVIRLSQMKTFITHTSRHMTIVTMKEQTYGDLTYKFVFLREARARKFYLTANRLAKHGESTDVQQRLGSDHQVLNESKSIRYAELVALVQMDYER
jgi:hypothetical protein